MSASAEEFTPPRTLTELFLGFLSIGARSFGGVMPWAHRVIVEERRWMSPEEFTATIGLCQFLPGPNVGNASIVLGKKWFGLKGSLVAFAGFFGLPFLWVLALASLYSGIATQPGVKAVVTGVAAVGGAAGQRVLTEVLAQICEHRAGVSPQFDSIGDARREVRFARLAMAGAPRGTSEVTAFDEAPVAVVAASAPDVLAEVSRTVLGSLNQLPDDDREVLVGTLRTWLAHGGSTEATAKALFCHPNTVRYRLNRVTEHTGRPLTDPLAVTELALALQGDLLSRCA